MKINPENYITDENKKNKYVKFLDPNILNIVLGSSHEGEEEVVMDALEGLNINLILAPRHPERVSKVIQLVKSKGFEPVKISEFERHEHKKLNNDKTIIIFDEVGELINLYAVADLVVVAGSIIFNKGHNFMEPVYANTTSITGSKLDNYKELKKELCDTNIFETFTTEQDLAQLLNKYKDNHYRIKKLNEQKEILQQISGSYNSVIKALDEL